MAGASWKEAMVRLAVAQRGFMNGDAAGLQQLYSDRDDADMRGYVQVGKVWQELPLKPADDGASGVVKIERKHVYLYVFDAHVCQFTQLLPNYMHVRFSDTMPVSPSSTPKDDVFERKDNYYVYLKPFDVAADVVLRRKEGQQLDSRTGNQEFPGKPLAWIPMPPH